MKHILYFASVVALAVVTSCGTKPGEAQADGSSTVTPINVNGNGNGLPQSTSPITTPSSITTQPITAPNLTTTPTATTTTVQQQPTTTVSTAKGMNPAHGQPGHNCDIEVGAPLNSAPSKNVAHTTPTLTSTPVTSTQNQVITSTTPTITSATTKVKTAPGMNPPHGEPGHRCDITVGAPLNSKPAATTTTTTSPTITPTINSNVIPGSIKPSIVNTTPAITTPTTTTAVKTAPGMNPAHGQPGHRCEIAVGAPLDSKPEPLKVVTPEKKNK
ncbi:MAG: hypothetical protein LH619_04450 [Chitinophagaceae bacterium]|nr:hypothetical protein [Chitinophagaceae bacterium]